MTRMDYLHRFAEFGRLARLGTLAAIVIGLVLLAGHLWKCYQRRKDSRATKRGSPTLMIESLENFNWKDTEPLKLRPFKPVYNITLALQSTTPSDLIIMDKNYLDRINLRRQLIAQHGSAVHGCLPQGEAAVREIYTYLLGEYLPTRYPTMFRLSKDTKHSQNLVTGRSYPVMAPADATAALRVLGETVDDDMFFLRQTPEGQFVDAFLCCFPGGFDPSQKFGKLLRDVHGPVPAYEKIGPSMERFFSRLEVGKSVKRMNWSIQTHGTLYRSESHATSDNDGSDEKDNFKIEDTWARMELQTATRLPQTRAALFSFKTYMYPIREIKEEGLGPDLADAIGGLKTGNAPGMWVYKGGEKWADRVREYLRS